MKEAPASVPELYFFGGAQSRMPEFNQNMIQLDLGFSKLDLGGRVRVNRGAFDHMVDPN